MEIANAGAEGQDALLAVQDGGRLEPLATVVVGTEQAEASDVHVARELGQRALELLEGEVEGVVLDSFAGLFEGLEEQVDLAEVSGW